MRLGVLDHDHKLPARLFLRTVATVTRQEVDDVAKTAMHRPEFWGKPFFEVGGPVLRGESFWSPGEREFFAAFSSRLNDCPFCASVHAETTRQTSRGAVDPDDPASVRPEVRAVLPLLEKVSRDPDNVVSADVDAVRVQGVPDEAIVDALYVNFIFNVVNRMANAFGWNWNSEAHVRMAARVINATKYALPGFTLR